jgi:S1-C subfamily serine protease
MSTTKSTENTSSIFSMMRHHSTILAVLLIAGIITLFPKVGAAVDRRTWEASIRDANLNSVLYISVKAHRSNGLDEVYGGSGFIVHSSGYVLTCNHVIPQESEFDHIEIAGYLAGDLVHSYNLTIIRRDEYADLMLLKLPENKSWRSVKSIAKAEIDSEIVAEGFPLQKGFVDMPGLISGPEDDGPRLFTNACLMRGMSGGPVFNKSGDVVAIVAGGFEDNDTLDVVIPIDLAATLLQSVKSSLTITEKSQPQGTTRRSVLEIFSYAVDGQGDPQFPFKRLKPIIADMMAYLAGKSDRPDNLAALRTIAKDSEFPDPSELEKAWRDSDDILEIVGGTLFAKSNPTIVASTVYLGNLKGSLGSTTTDVTTAVRAEDYGNLDTFCALTAYALAMEAKSQGSNKLEVEFYLAAARGVLHEIALENTTTNTSREKLVADAIDAEWSICEQQ